ncbi:MAG: hypothetical protein IK082_05100 [Oscillospiraceae bacterium]|nr:hypothetical protein [Oscillospiraceae bacterium]
MEISKKDWKRYIKQLSAIDKKAADTMQIWMDDNPGADVEEMIWFAQNVASYYGEAAGALACEMYDAVAVAQGASVPLAEIADVPDYGETAKAVLGAIKNKQNTVPATVGRLVKRVGADTMLKNAQRDYAQFAWIPMGDTCAFCLTLASRGWQYMSKNAMKNGHAEHIHANCDCQYAIRFDEKSTVEGYDPDRYREMYDNAEGGTPQEKINAMRRVKYTENPQKIREQKRDWYARNRRLKYGQATDFATDRGTITARRVDRYGYNNIYVDENVTITERQLRNVNGQVSEAKQLLGVSDYCDAKVIVTDMGDTLASYNPRTNTILISSKMTSNDEIKKAQIGFTCPDDPRSTAVHEFLHWKDADEYRKTVGDITDASDMSPYSVYQRERARTALREAGVDVDNISALREISKYAMKSALENDWEEAYTEFRTMIILLGGA